MATENQNLLFLSFFFLTASEDVLVFPFRGTNKSLILAFPPTNYIWEEVMLLERSQNSYLENKNTHFCSLVQTRAFVDSFSIASQYRAQKPENQYTPNWRMMPASPLQTTPCDHPDTQIVAPQPSTPHT